MVFFDSEKTAGRVQIQANDCHKNVGNLAAMEHRSFSRRGINRLRSVWLRRACRYFAHAAILTNTLIASGPSPGLIPLPARIDLREGAGFHLTPQTSISLRDAPADAQLAVDAWRRVNKSTTLPLTVAAQTEGAIVFDFAPERWPKALQASTSPEAYVLDVSSTGIVVHARDTHGAFNAVQTIRQLLPPTWESDSPPTDAVIPAQRVEDEPRYRWRGLLVDSARHMQPVAGLKKVIDLMALHKLNTLHWHLTDDQGWRLEIRQYPKLTSVGAWRQGTQVRRDKTKHDGIRYGGYYTQAEIREIVAYAATRFITVVPEIGLPGHCTAALAAYPELGNSDLPNFNPPVGRRMGVYLNTYAPKEETFRFLENVFREVFELFPSPYIHLGGDEVRKNQWRQSTFAQAFMRERRLKDENELQSYFVGRMAEFIQSHGRQVIGWDEIQEGGTAPTATIMVWRTTAPSSQQTAGQPRIASWTHLKSALSAGRRVIITPHSHLYLDHSQHPTETIPGQPSTIEHVYSFDPELAGLDDSDRALIQGVEGALWSERIYDTPMLEYRAFPRVCALAEIAWSPQSVRDYASFEARWQRHLLRLEELGVNFFTAEPSEKR